MADLNSFDDATLEAIASGNLDSLPDDVLARIAGEAPEVTRTPKQAMGDIIDINMRAMGFPSRGIAANLLRGASSFVGGAGGPVGAAAGGGGEAVAQLVEGFGIDRPGDVAAAATVSSVPLAKPAAMAGKAWTSAKNALRLMGGVGVGEEVRSVIDEGQLSNPLDEMAVAGGLSATVPIVGKAVSKIVGSVDPADIARVASEQRRNATRDASLAGGRELGMVVPPTAVNDNWLNRRIEGLAGGPRVGREATLINNQRGGAAIRQDIGVASDTPMTSDVMKTLKTQAAEPYRKVEALSENGGVTMYHDGTGGFLTTDANAVRAGASQSAKFAPKNPMVLDRAPTAQEMDDAFTQGHDAIVVDSGTGRIDAFIPDQPGRAVIYKGSPIDTAADDMAAWKRANSDASDYFNAAKYAPENKVKGRAAKAKAEALLDRMEVAAAQSGDPKLVNELKQARRDYAKLVDAEKTLNPDNGEFDLNKLGNMSARGKPLTGNMAKAGGFANAFGGRFTRPSASIPNPGVSALEPANIFLGGIVGGVKGAVAGTANVFIRDPIRKGILSEAGQRWLAAPDYNPPTSLPPDLVNGMQRLSAKLTLLNGENRFLGTGN